MKKHNLKVIQIRGFRGLMLALFIISCLLAGFIAFPSFLLMCLWNALALKISSWPEISFYGGLLLWGIIVVSIMIFNKRKFLVSLDTPKELSEDELNQVLAKIKATDFSNLQKELNEIKKTETKDINIDSKDN